MALAAYQTFTQFLLHDPAGQAYAISNITTAINRVRLELAAKCECVRALLSGGTVTSLALAAGGSGYSNGTWPLVFTGAGSQTSGTALVSGNTVTGVTLTSGGWGWVAGNPVISVSPAAGGSGAVINATVDLSAATVTAQEVYAFATLNNLAVQTPGVQSVIGINMIAAQWGAGSVYKPTLQRRTFAWFQANARVYSIAAMNFPAYWASYGQGGNGSFYLFPIPAQVMSMDLDAICLPIPLVDDTTIEAIPPIWTEAIPFGAAYYCYLSSQRLQDAQLMYAEYIKYLELARKASQASAFVPDQYTTV